MPKNFVSYHSVMREQRVRANYNKIEPYLVHELNEFYIASDLRLRICVFVPEDVAVHDTTCHPDSKLYFCMHSRMQLL
jgi:hypothetical protein